MEVVASRWRSFCEAATPYLGEDGWLDAHGLGLALQRYPAFVTRKRQFLLFKWVVKVLNEHGHAVPDPTLELYREFSGEDRPDHLVVDLLQHRRAMAEAASTLVSGWKGVRLVAIVSLTAECGLKTGELCGLPLSAVTPTESGYKLRVVGKKGVSPREFILSEDASRALAGWIKVHPAADSGLLFVSDASGRAVDPVTLWRQIKRVEAKSGPVVGALSGTTAFRAALAQQMQAEGRTTEEIQKALGHRMLASTIELLERTRSTGTRRRKKPQPTTSSGLTRPD